MRTVNYLPELKQKTFGVIAALIISFLATTAPAQPRVALNEETYINSSLLSAAIGAIIQKKCSTISPRLVLAIWKARALQRYALNQGYTKEEIAAFIENKKEQRRMRRAAFSYLRANGVVKDEEQTYCAAGRAEIARGTLTGQLLRGS